MRVGAVGQLFPSKNPSVHFVSVPSKSNAATGVLCNNAAKLVHSPSEVAMNGRKARGHLRMSRSLETNGSRSQVVVKPHATIWLEGS